jgi:ferredoxin/flavodoxin
MDKDVLPAETAIVYFSGTGVTRAIATVIRGRLVENDCRADLIDITPYTVRKNPSLLESYSGLVFAFPVYSDFAPAVVNDWLPTLAGRGRPCVLCFTYGARTTGYAHFHTDRLLRQAGFRVLASAEFLGRHTFNLGGWRVLPDRPDESDFCVARRYADLVGDRLRETDPPDLRLQKPFRYNQTVAAWAEEKPRTERSWTNPVRTASACGLCRMCEKDCPAAAFDAEKGVSDPGRCLSCLRCVTACPEKAIAIDPRMAEVYPQFLEDWHLTEEMIKAKRSKIIEDFTQAVW